MMVNGQTIKKSVSFAKGKIGPFDRTEQEAEYLCIKQMRDELAVRFD